MRYNVGKTLAEVSMQITDISESKKFKKVISKDQQGSEQFDSILKRYET
jgi:hypothetical protein